MKAAAFILCILVAISNCEKPSRYKVDLIMMKFLDRLAKSPYMFYKVHEFNFNPNSWTNLSLHLKYDHHLDILEKYSADEIHTIFSKAQLEGDGKQQAQVKFYALNFEVGQNDLFSNPKDWTVSNEDQTKGLDQVLAEGDFIIEGVKKAHLTKVNPKSEAMDFEFLLGDPIHVIKNNTFHELEKGHLAGLKNFDLVFSKPRLEFLANDRFEKLKYQCFLHAFQNTEVVSGDSEDELSHDKAFQLISAITVYILKHPELLKKKHMTMQLSYRYQDIAILVRDHLKDFKRWMSATSPNEIVVNAFFVLKSAFTEPGSLFTFDRKGNLKDIHHGLGTGPAPFLDMPRDGMLPHAAHEGSFDDNPELNSWVDMRIKSMFDKIEHVDVQDGEMDGFRHWMINTLREDFRKFRNPHDNQTFFVSDEAFFSKTRAKDHGLIEHGISGL